MDSTERSVSFWEATTSPLTFPPLASDVTADVCVIGAGIAGLTTAYLLAREGRRVVVLDRAAIGGGETGQTTAHLASEIDDFYHVVERMHGKEGARIAFESQQGAIERIALIVAEAGIDCDLLRNEGFLLLAPGDDVASLEKERDAAARAGFPGVEVLPRAPLGFWDTGPCLRFPNQGQLHPLKYLHGLARAAEKLGVAIHTGTEVSEPPADGSPIRVTTASGHSVTAADVVMATNYPLTRAVSVVPRIASYRTFVVGFTIPRDTVPPVLLWDTGDPYHYVRTARGSRPGEELLIVGGEDHKTGQADDADERFAHLVAWTREHFPMVPPEPVHRWSGQVQEPVDHMGLIGRHPGQEHVYIITGDSGQGMTTGTVGAMMVADLIAGRESPWSPLYDPSRSSFTAPLEMVKENLNVASQFKDYLTRGDVSDVGEVRAGEGAVIHRGGHPIAVFRDEAGALHECSAVCTHMGCIVAWNHFEMSWDCPCHGSRFGPLGDVLTGPAVQPLAKPGE